MSFLTCLVAALILAITPGPRTAYVVKRTAAGGRAEGLASCVKTALFFLAFLPHFVRAAEPVVPQLVLLGMTCVVLNTLVDIVAVLSSAWLLASRAAQAARARLLRQTSGATMVVLGTLLALSRRES